MSTTPAPAAPFQVGLWHNPLKTDNRYETVEMAEAAARKISLRIDTSLVCVWEWVNGTTAQERRLVINGQVWRPS